MIIDSPEKSNEEKSRYRVAYEGIFNSLNLYWKCYGGLPALITSPYLHSALVITLTICWPAWWSSGGPWFDISCSILPNLLGFTLAGYAILMSLGSDKFIRIISGNFGDNKVSPFMEANGTFVHFIIIQVLALLLGLIGKMADIKQGLLALVGVFFLVYSIMLGVAAGLAILNIAEWRELFLDVEAEKSPDKPPPEVKL
jgi:hypothetical protein